MENESGPPAEGGYTLDLIPSRQFVSWLYDSRLSIAVTTYQAGKLFLLGSKDSQQISVFERTLNRCMGLCVDRDALYVSSLYQIWRFQNALADGAIQNGYDRLFVPQVGWITGDLDVHDIAVDGDKRLIFVNTLFSCIAAVSNEYSFLPLWSPPWISRLAAEDRCHLNGMALRDGVPRYVTAVARTDVADGWRDQRVGGGVVVDVVSNEILADGLTMPHSPRWYRGRLWVLDSGSGQFGTIDVEKGRFEAIAFCPGYLRGLSFFGDYALVGLSKAREAHSFGGLPVAARLEQLGQAPRCGIYVIDLRSGDIVHWLLFDGAVEEIFEVAALEGVKCPMAVGFKTDEIRRLVTIGDPIPVDHSQRE